MTVSRIRDNRRTQQAQHAAAGRAEVTKVAPDTARDSDYQDYLDRVQPAAVAHWTLCNEVEQAIVTGGEGASPERIRQALAVPADVKISAYTQKYRDDLAAACLNYGIDPATGQPNRNLQRIICESIRIGYSQRAALAIANLAAHTSIPNILLRDDEFREAVQAASART